MEGIEHDADIVAAGAAHDLPGVAVVVDMAAPGQRLVADLDAAPGGAFPELREIAGEPVDAGKGLRRDGGADEEQVAAEFLQQVEFPLGPVEGLLAPRLRHALEIAEGLAGDDRQPEIGADSADLGGRAGKGDQVVLKNLDRGEAGRGDGLEFFAQGAGDTNCRDRGDHADASAGSLATARRSSGVVEGRPKNSR